MWSALAVGLVSLGAGLSGAAAQDKQGKQDNSCEAGPGCVAADQEAQRRIAGWSNLMAGRPSTHIASMVAYCTNDAVAQTARRCQAEFQSMASALISPTTVNKKKACLALAEQSRQQAEGSDQIAKAALRNAYASAASSGWRPDCSNIKVPVPHAGKWLFTIGNSAIWTTMDPTGSFMGQSSGSVTMDSTTYGYSQQISGRASESGVTATSARSYTDSRIVSYPTECAGQRSGNGYAGTCTSLSPSGASWTFQLIPQ